MSELTPELIHSVLTEVRVALVEMDATFEPDEGVFETMESMLSEGAHPVEVTMALLATHQESTAFIGAYVRAVVLAGKGLSAKEVARGAVDRYFDMLSKEE